METTLQAFRAGWLHGHRHGRHQSMREVLDTNPGMSAEFAEVYLNGQDDGIKGDTFRLNYGAEERRAA
jgi:hypothetical protein